MIEIKLHGTHDDVSILSAELGKIKGFALELEEREERHFRIRIVARCFSNEEGFVVIKLGDFYVESDRRVLNLHPKYWSFRFVYNWRSIRANFYDEEYKDISYVKKEIKKKIKFLNKEVI